MPKTTNPLKPLKNSPVSPQWIEGKTLKEVLDAGLAFIENIEDPDTTIRVAAVRMYFSGAMKMHDVAAHYGINNCTISEWVKNTKLYGYESLVSNKAGRPSTVDKDLEKELQDIIFNKHPNEYGYNSWSSQNVSSLLDKYFGKKLTPRNCQELLKRLGIDDIKLFVSAQGVTELSHFLSLEG